jgi:hypothetical protein
MWCAKGVPVTVSAIIYQVLLCYPNRGLHSLRGFVAIALIAWRGAC